MERQAGSSTNCEASGARDATRPAFDALLNMLTRAKNSARWSSVGAVADFNRKTDQVVVAGFDFGKIQAFDNPDFGAEQRVMSFDAVFVKTAH